MLINKHTGNISHPPWILSSRNQHVSAVSTNKILLVPYEESHVITYHEWMKDEEIQLATASEPLSLEEEYDMQRSWRTDHDKLTFIICLPEEGNASPEIRKGVSDAPAKMIGDVNLFITEADEDEEGCIGEIEIMIAERSARGKGLGRSAVVVFLEYLRSNQAKILEEYRKGIQGKNEEGKMKLLQLRVKIGGKNVASIGLFESVGFVKVGEGENYFGEVELVFEGWCGEERVKGLMERFGVEAYQERGYR